MPLAAVLILRIVLIGILIIVLVLSSVLVAVLILVLVIHDLFLRVCDMRTCRFYSLPGMSGFILGFKQNACD